MDKEIKEILEKTENGEKVIEYIEELEEHILHHHHHDDDCDCGCHDDNDDDEWKEIKTPYKNVLTVKDWEKLLKDKTVFDKEALAILKRMRHIAAPTSSVELADTFGFGAYYYVSETEKLAERLLPYVKAKNLEKEQYWSVLFQCWQGNDEYETKIYGLIPELYEALGNVDLSDIPLRENEV